MDRWMMGGGGVVRSYLDQEGGGRVPLKPHQDQGGFAPLFLFFFSASCGRHEDLCHNTQTPERLRAAAAATAAGRRKKRTKANKHSGREAEQTNVEYYLFFICLPGLFFSRDITGGACACRSKSMPASLCRFVKRGDAPRSPRNNSVETKPTHPTPPHPHPHPLQTPSEERLLGLCNYSDLNSTIVRAVFSAGDY